jgi:hypothetical protein
MPLSRSDFWDWVSYFVAVPPAVCSFFTGLYVLGWQVWQWLKTADWPVWWFQCLWRDQRGASMIDYAILAALITTLIRCGGRGGRLLELRHVGALAAQAVVARRAVQSSGLHLDHRRFAVAAGEGRALAWSRRSTVMHPNLVTSLME